MRFVEVMELGSVNITAHKKRSLLTIFSIGLLFGAIFAVLFVLQSTQNTLMVNAENSTADGVVVLQTYSETTAMPDLDQYVNDKTQFYGGGYAGNVLGYNKNGVYYQTISAEFAKTYLNIDLSDCPESAIPVVVSLDKAAELAEIPLSYRAEEKSAQKVEEIVRKLLYETVVVDGIEYYIAKISPNRYSDISLSVNKSDLNPLSIPFSMTSGASAAPMTIIDHNSVKLVNLLEGAELEYKFVLSAFDDAESAYSYYSNEDCGALERNCNDYVVMETFSNQIKIKGAFSKIYNVLGWVILTLVLVAVIIMVFTFIRLIDQDAKLVALYRSLGASKRQIIAIHFSYMVELCVLAGLFAIAIGAAIALSVISLNAGKINVALTLMYGTGIKKIFIDCLSIFSLRTLYILLGVFASAPVSLIFSLDQFSDKNISKKLREE